MNKNNEKQKTTYEIYWEPKKIYEHIKGKTNENHKNQWKNQRRNNEKTMENQRQFCQHSKLLLPEIFVPVFSRFSSSLGKEIRDNFDGKKQS